MLKTKKTYAIRYVNGQPVKHIVSDFNSQPKYSRIPKLPLTITKTFRVMVWNILKQQRKGWLSVLKKNGENTQLMLLQEVKTNPEMLDFVASYYLTADQVPAFSLPKHSYGVMTLSSAFPVYCYPLRTREPLLGFSKSALITVYPTYKENLLMVINIHAINFSLGIENYNQQLEPIGKQIAAHKGPVILAGDFNTWSKKRVKALKAFTQNMNLEEVSFPVDNRSLVFGRPLDFIFFRGLNLIHSSVLATQASDHNPLLVQFDVSSNTID
ncbi:EEP domain-containing protein [Candidatus Williamhamiltonella defendens]|uniref:EEP domain-containing protein n=1 Tax=Candidatus Williamhamiltonella defendens TaxID=138072 RepID=A0A2D3TA91_9ENTR|nr:endonuclease/exonuclease/phosphatase family protein [Candidatus Hamiltonella defensa]ASV34182.1 EEP domain-containing protein [Candidatus Hamiltonella defensa]ATW30441.1 EEP domain-containing protein [Candidatus Hamiltonella defensa]ATW32451.1 EEP domain-containing protein [Candidatus Hamiltonella defensa]ATW34418.1 EEP domain-containing protein [Candidatus Hamiltonella defensa]AWK17140.1 EEP domain-containing protein [Candidatus Hamiltonella defensa]